MYAMPYASPIGQLTLYADDRQLCRIAAEGDPVLEAEAADRSQPVLGAAAAWLDAFFDGKQPDPHSLPLQKASTPFQQHVREALMGLPYGQTISYGGLARLLQLSGIPAGAQAIGQAMHHNPLPLVVPCHRVVASHGLGGYGPGGSRKKLFLLTLEGNTQFGVEDLPEEER